jgi:hypothetical protein
MQTAVHHFSWTFSRMAWPLLTIVLLIGVSGCRGPRLYPVRGKVVYKDGSPLSGGMVVFETAEGDAKVSAVGPIRADGTFELGTYRARDGALAGKYRVLVEPPLPPKLEERNPPPPPIHPRFRKFDTSQLEFIVGPDHVDFTIVVEKP